MKNLGRTERWKNRQGALERAALRARAKPNFNLTLAEAELLVTAPLLRGPDDWSVAIELRKKLIGFIESEKPRKPLIAPDPGNEYKALLETVAWGPRDRFGHAVSELNPLLVLRAAEAPEPVIAAVTLAIRENCAVLFESHACHIGGSEYISVLEPVPAAVRAALDAIDASDAKDGRLVVMKSKKGRWFSGEHRVDRRARWEWTLSDY